VRIASFDGAEVPAFLHEPAAPDGRALVVVHGGPESQYAAHWRPEVQALLARGWTVLAPNVRGSTGYGRAWRSADDRERRMDAVADLHAVRGWLAERPGVEASRLAVLGQSYGGFMVLASIAEHPEDWRAAASLYGIADFRSFMATTGPWRRALRAAEYGDPDTEEGRALLARISPMARIERVRTPLLLAHGLEDPRVPPGESEMVASALRGRGRRVELHRVEREGHGFVRAASRRRVFGALTAFLERETGRPGTGHSRTDSDETGSDEMGHAGTSRAGPGRGDTP
jgi:dipeptidyl aminopeptidase/acylaminoacyl peptidase